MVKKISLACGIALALFALTVSAALPAYAATSDTEISAGALPGLCAAGGGHVAVPSNSALDIQGGTALISSECDITLGDNASVSIQDAVIDARGGGDFDICFFPPCGTNVSVQIQNSTIYAGTFTPPLFSLGTILSAPGSSSQLQVDNSTLNAGPGQIFTVTSDGTTSVQNTTFNASGINTIHGGVECQSQNNTPAVPCS